MSRLLENLLQSYREEPRGQCLGRSFVPSRTACVGILERCLEILYPGYYGAKGLTFATIEEHLRARLSELRLELREQIGRCLCYGHESCAETVDVPCCKEKAVELSEQFLDSLPEIRRLLILDAQAAIDGDPAATNLDEVILSYPGFLAISVHRLAHRLHQLGVPMMPRIMSEWAHSRTGADLHPGAEIGESFFLDHATGAVIGATSRLGRRVRMYQGVTLGALSLPRDATGKVSVAGQRHPTIEDDVTLYANAIILGGQTVVGQGSVIGGSVFLTRSVAPEHRVILDPPRLRVQGPVPDSGPNGRLMTCEVDFEI